MQRWVDRRCAVGLPRVLIGILSISACIGQLTHGEPAPDGRWEGNTEKPFAFRFSVTQADREPRPGHATCVGAWIAPRWIITAGHCVNSGVRGLQIVGTKLVRESYAIENYIAHPILDLALLNTSHRQRHTWSQVRLAQTLRSVDTSTLSGMELQTAALPGNDNFHPGPDGTVRLLEESRNATTMWLRPKSGCLKRGDSGTPVRFLGVPSTDSIVGLLVRGSPTCTGYQTALRLDIVAPWVYTQLGSHD